MAGQAGNNGGQRRESAEAAAAAAASAQSGRFPHRAGDPSAERGTRPSRGEGAGGGGRGRPGRGLGGRAAQAVASAGPSAGRATPRSPPGGCGPIRAQRTGLGPQLVSGVASAALGPGTWKTSWKHLWMESLVGGRPRGGAGSSRPPSLPAPQPVPGSGVTAMNAEPSGCLSRMGSLPKPRVRDRQGAGAAPRNQQVRPEHRWPADAKSCDGRLPPPRRPLPACGSFPRRPGSGSGTQSHRCPRLLASWPLVHARALHVAT